MNRAGKKTSSRPCRIFITDVGRGMPRPCDTDPEGSVCFSPGFSYQSLSQSPQSLSQSESQSQSSEESQSSSSSQFQLQELPLSE